MKSLFLMEVVLGFSSKKIFATSLYVVMLIFVVGNAWAAPAQVEVYCSYNQVKDAGEYVLSLEGPQIKVSGMTFLVRYDKSVLEFSGLKQSDLTRSAMVAKENKDGILKFGFVSPSAIREKGALFTVLFKQNGAGSVGVKTLKLEKATASDDLGKMINVRIKQ